jgi:hypothetical protein
MTVMRRTSVLGLALLLAATPAAADTVVTTKEVISCSVVSADADSIRFNLTRPRGRALSGREAYELTWRRRKMLSTRDVYEIRLSDSSRVAELAAQLPGVRVILDSGQPVPPPAVRAREMTRLQLDRAPEARASGVPGHARGMDTLPPNASPAEMAVRCRYMDAWLRGCGRRDGTVVELLCEVDSEQEAIREIRPRVGTCLVYGGCGSLPGMVVGMFVGSALGAAGNGDLQSAGIGVAAAGCAAGGALGFITGVAIRVVSQKILLVGHRRHVNDLIHRVNRAVASPR